MTLERVVQRFYSGEPAKATKRPNTESERNALIVRLVNKNAFISELGRMVRDCIKDPYEREKCYWKLIACVDFSNEWHDKASKEKLAVLLERLKTDEWKDTEDEDGST